MRCSTERRGTLDGQIARSRLARGAARRAPWRCRRRGTLEPHVAAYRLTLADQTAIGNPFIEVRGGLVIEWRLACDGWLSRQRLALRRHPAGRRRLWATTCASAAGSRSTARACAIPTAATTNDQLQEEFRGDARARAAARRRGELHDAERAPGRSAARHDVPDRAHAAGAGQSGAPASSSSAIEVFDGAGFDALTQITSVIGQPRLIEPSTDHDRAGAGGVAGQHGLLRPARARRTRPSSKRSFLLDEDGVIRDVVLDYGEFRLGRSAGQAGDDRAPRLLAPAGSSARLRPSQAAPRTPEESPCIGRQQRRAHGVGEHVAIPDRGHGGVQALELGQAAAEHDRLRIEQIDHRGEPARQAQLVAAQRRLGRRIADRRSGDDRRRVPLDPGRARDSLGPARGRTARSRCSPRRPQ